MKIAVIGPVVPFRGGIAQHTTRLANALADLTDVTVITFSRLYPRWLYPGKFQTEQSGLRLVPFAQFVLDAVNPFSWLRTVAHIEAESPSCAIFPWWTFFLAPCYSYLARRLRRRGIPVLFFCHNVVDHEVAGWKKLLVQTVLRHGTGFVVQTRDEAEKLRTLLGDVEVLYHPHPVYDQFPSVYKPLPRRALLELLFYGFIRPYKGLDVLLVAMAGLGDVDVHLSIVGEPWGKNEVDWQRRIQEAGIGERVEFVPHYASDEETARYFARADAVVLPYRSATGTGVVATAYHYRKPVIASCVGGLRDVVAEGKTGLLIPPDDPQALAAAIRRFAMDGIENSVANIAQAAEEMTWEHLTGEMLDFIAKNQRQTQ